MPRPRKQALRQTDLPTDPADLLGSWADESGGSDDSDEADRRPSKSALKRQAHELQRLGDSLVALRPEQLKSMPIGEALRDAIELAHRIKAREGLRRQRQLIGKLMRDADADAIREALDLGSASHRAELAMTRAAEDWRERMITDTTALAAFRRRFGDDDDPGLARLVEEARAERAGLRSGGSYRSLYRKLLAAIRSQDAARKAAESQDHPPEHPQEQP